MLRLLNPLLHMPDAALRLRNATLNGRGMSIDHQAALGSSGLYNIGHVRAKHVEACNEWAAYVIAQKCYFLALLVFRMQYVCATMQFHQK